MKTQDILLYYYRAKELIYKRGYYAEVYLQEKQSVFNISEQLFLREYSWVVLSSGLKEAVVKAKFPALSQIFNDWLYLNDIVVKKKPIREKALKIFGNQKKIDSILYMVEYLATSSIKNEINCILNEGVHYLQRFPYLGPATSFHLAKNLGFNVAKPDRHLVRISRLFGYNCVESFCKMISYETGEKVSVIDIVLWRYATLNSKYLE